MSNGYYTSPTYNYPAPKNVGGYNATQLSLQKQIQDQVRLKNAQMVRDAKTFANAPTFSDHIKEFWGLKINEFSNAQNEWIGGNMSATESANIKENLEILWKTWTTAAPYVAALGETVRKYGTAGELDKLNDPNLEALLSHMQQNDGSVVLKNDGNKLYLSGRGEIDEKNVNGENTGNKLPWEYDLDLESFLQIIGVNTYEQDPDGSGTSDTILNNLNNIIQRRATDQTIDLESTITAAISQSDITYDVPIIEKGKETDRTQSLNFTPIPVLQRKLNHGGLNGTGLGSTTEGTTMWVGTEDNPSIMNSSQFASYYANVLYKDYQPHYNDMGDIDWLIDYDDSGNEVDRVKPWNLSDQSLWDPARDMLTKKAITGSQKLNQAMMLQLKPNYQEILDTEYNGDWLEFTKKGNAGHEISRNPFEFYEGTTDNAQGFWEMAQKNNPLSGETPTETPVETNGASRVSGAVKTEADCDAATQAFDPISKQCVPKARYTGNKIFSDWATNEENPKNMMISKNRTTTEDIIESINIGPWGEYTSADYFESIKGSDGKPLGAIISDSDPDNDGKGEIEIFIPNVTMKKGDKWHNQGWKRPYGKDNRKGLKLIVDINFSTDKSIQNLVDKIYKELKAIGAQNL